MKDLNKQLGSRVKSLRVAKRMSQEELAARVERTWGAISKIERGVTAPSIETLLRLAKALECELADLVKNTHEKSGPKSVARKHQEDEAWALVASMSDADLAIALAALRGMASVKSR